MRIAIVLGSATVLAALVVGCAPEPAADTAAFSARGLPFPGGPGSAQPRLSSGDGTTVLSWLEPTEDGVALRYSTFDGGSFSPPREVVRGSDLFVNWADLPSVQPITADVWAAHWLKLAPDSAGAYHVVTAV